MTMDSRELPLVFQSTFRPSNEWWPSNRRVDVEGRLYVTITPSGPLEEVPDPSPLVRVLLFVAPCSLSRFRNRHLSRPKFRVGIIND